MRGKQTLKEEGVKFFNRTQVGGNRVLKTYQVQGAELISEIQIRKKIINSLADHYPPDEIKCIKQGIFHPAGMGNVCTILKTLF